MFVLVVVSLTSKFQSVSSSFELSSSAKPSLLHTHLQNCLSIRRASLQTPESFRNVEHTICGFFTITCTYTAVSLQTIIYPDQRDSIVLQPNQHIAEDNTRTAHGTYSSTSPSLLLTVLPLDFAAVAAAPAPAVALLEPAAG